jgi:hypothetical protein
MVRVESQVTRQALLVVGDEMETDPPPEKLELYTEDGLAVDVGKDRTRARWRGEWVTTPTAPYEQNDFVMHDEKLYILSDFEAYNGVDAPPAAGWAIMTISAGMQFFGEWAAGGYKKQSVVTRDNKLWTANVDIIEGEFSFVGSDWDDQYGGSDTISVQVPDGTVVGDVMIWVGSQSHYAKRQRPSDYIDWVELHSDGINDDGFPPGHVELYAKVVEEADIGADKVCTENPGENGTVQLLVFHNTGIPIAAEVDTQKFQVDSLPTTLTATAGADPAETNAEDKVVRVYMASAQNFAIDSGNYPDFSSASDSHDELIFDIHQLFGGGSYWADAAASSLPSFVWSSGEHKYVIRYNIRMPSPTGFNEDQWTLIGILEGGGGGDAAEIEIEDFHEVGAIGEPAFTNSWAAHASADHKPRFRKRPDGTVEMRGLLISGNSDQSAFTLPAGYRPVSPGGLQMVAMAADVGTGAAHPVRLDVNPDGTVVPGIAGSSLIWLSLAAIEFSTGQDTFPAGVITETAEAWRIVGAGGEPAFQNSWGAGSPAVTKFRKRADGMVELRGFAVKGSPSGRSVIFTLPVGYRIESAEDVMRFPVSGSSTGYVEVFSNGEVKCDEMAYVSLDPVQFSVE